MIMTAGDDVSKADVPAWYELKNTKHGITIELSPEADVSSRSFPISRFAGMADKLQIPDLISPNEDKNGWGFGEIFRAATPTYPDWMAWELQFPGYGKEALLWASAASLSLLFSTLSVCRPVSKTKETEPKIQLLNIKSFKISKDGYGNGFSVAISPRIVNWIHKQKDNNTDNPITMAMRDAYKVMGGQRISTLNAHFRQPKWVNLNCPGNACGLDPDNYYEESLFAGYKLLPHNVDTPLQSIVLFTGIAAIYAAARQDGF